MVTIIAAETESHMQEIRTLVREFVAWGISAFHQDQDVPPAVVAKLEQELSALPGKYAAPGGGLFIAYIDGEAAGCVAGFKSERGSFEVSRLWVRSAYRGDGVGDMLVAALLSEASRLGYQRSVLRSRQEMTSAHNVYRRAGFVDVDGKTEFSNFETVEVAMALDLH